MIRLLHALTGAGDGPERQEAGDGNGKVEQVKHLNPSAMNHCKKRGLRKSLAGR